MAPPVTHSPLGIEVREEQQRIVLDALVAANGEPVPYARLRDAGVEFPASVIAELELAGLSVNRSLSDGPALRTSAPAVRLIEPPDAAEPPPASVLFREPPARRGRRRGALIAIAVTIVTALTVLAAVGSLSSRPHRPSARRTTALAPRTPHRTAPALPKPRRVAPLQRPRPPARTPTVPVTQQSAAALQLSGHELLAGGRYAQATVLLRRAMQATGMDVARCAQPVDDGCLVYAYALYDLGRALLLEGRPREATLVLEERLRIANQEGVVASELAVARASARVG